jgi:hypothetical protein
LAAVVVARYNPDIKTVYQRWKLLTTRVSMVPELDHVFAIRQVCHGDTPNFVGLFHDRRSTLSLQG